MPDFGIFRGFNEKLFGDKLVAGQLPTQLGLIGSEAFGVDPDAQAFINAAGITDATQQGAIDTFVKDLKSAGIWSKMIGIYPFVGGSATSHKYNLKDPRDLDAAFRLTFSGGWTHSSNGITGNGGNSYADTFFKPSLNYDDFDSGYSIYSKTNNAISKWDFGAFPGYHVYLNYPSIGCKAAIQSGDGQRTSFNDNDSSGLFTFITSANNVRKAYRNSILKDTNTSVSTTLRTSLKLIIGALNNNGSIGSYSNRNYAFAGMHESLTDTEASDLYNAVQAFQTTLGREV